MTWSVPHPTFWSTKSRIILVCVRNSGFSRILSPTTRDHFRAMFVWFSYPEKTWRRSGNFLLRLLHVLSFRVCSTTMVNFLCLRFNSTATGQFTKRLFSLQTCWVIFVWKVVEMTFIDYNSFCFWVNKNIRLYNHAKRTLCKNADFAAIYSFSVNSYQTSAKVTSIP